VGQGEGEVAEHLDVLVLQRREAREVLIGDLVAGGAELGDGVVEVLGVPEHERVEREAERAELVFLPVAVGLTQLTLVAVEDDPGDGVPALVAVEPDAGLAAQFLAVDPAEQVQRLGDPAELGDRPPESAAASAALEYTQQLGGADGPGRQRAGDAQDVLPLLADQVDVDAVAGEAVEWSVVGVAVDAPEALIGQASGAGAELVAQQPEQPEDLIGVGGLVGDDRRRAAVAGRLEFEQAVEDHQRIAQGAGDDDRV
jgi:hypothetical protein